MLVIESNKIIKDFFKSVKLEKIKGILVKGTCEENTFFSETKEDFFKKHCEEDEVYICDKFYDNDYPYTDLDQVQELLEDDFEEYLKTLNITDKEYDELLDYFNQEDLDYLIEEFTENKQIDFGEVIKDMSDIINKEFDEIKSREELIEKYFHFDFKKEFATNNQRLRHFYNCIKNFEYFAKKFEKNKYGWVCSTDRVYQYYLIPFFKKYEETRK